MTGAAEWAAWWFASGHAVDLVLSVVALEALWLITRGGWHAGAVVMRLMPGVMMLLAVRCALVGAGWPLVALFLAASLPFHIADLRRGKRRLG